MSLQEKLESRDLEIRGNGRWGDALALLSLCGAAEADGNAEHDRQKTSHDMMSLSFVMTTGSLLGESERREERRQESCAGRLAACAQEPSSARNEAARSGWPQAK